MGSPVEWRHIGPTTLVLTAQDKAGGIHAIEEKQKAMRTSCGLLLKTFDWLPAIWMKIEDVDCPDCKVHIAAAILRREPG